MNADNDIEAVVFKRETDDVSERRYVRTRILEIDAYIIDVRDFLKTTRKRSPRRYFENTLWLREEIGLFPQVKPIPAVAGFRITPRTVARRAPLDQAALVDEIADSPSTARASVSPAEE